VTPSTESVCVGCRKAFSNEMAWKVPLIIGMYILAIIVTIAILANGN
jgi:hypothetical protein